MTRPLFGECGLACRCVPFRDSVALSLTCQCHIGELDNDETVPPCIHCDPVTTIKLEIVSEASNCYASYTGHNQCATDAFSSGVSEKWHQRNWRMNSLYSLKYRKHVAVSSCLLQMWQHWSLCWLVQSRREEFWTRTTVADWRRGLLLVRASLLQLWVLWLRKACLIYLANVSIPCQSGKQPGMYLACYLPPEPHVWPQTIGHESSSCPRPRTTESKTVQSQALESARMLTRP